MSIIDEIKESFRENGVVTKLIYINIGVFLVLRMWGIVAFFGGMQPDMLVYFVAMPTTPEFVIYKPWTIFTYMFSHYDIIHILFNLLCLHWFGRLFTYIYGGGLVLRTYLIGGLAGAVACMLGASILPVGSVMLGASASVLALLLAVAVYAPNNEVRVVFIGNVKLKYYALFFIVIDIISIPGLVNAGGHIAHLGGALAGAAMGLWWKSKGIPDVKPWTFPNIFGSKPKMKVVHKRALTDMEYNAQKVDRAREVDRILEKIKRSGYDSLTEKERRTLFEESKK